MSDLLKHPGLEEHRERLKLKIKMIELTDEEILEALFKAKQDKYFREKHAPYWEKCDPDKKVKK